MAQNTLSRNRDLEFDQAACFSLAKFRQKENLKIFKFGHIVSCGGREGSIVRTEKNYTYIKKIARISIFGFHSVAIIIES